MEKKEKKRKKKKKKEKRNIEVSKIFNFGNLKIEERSNIRFMSISSCVSAFLYAPCTVYIYIYISNKPRNRRQALNVIQKHYAD